MIYISKVWKFIQGYVIISIKGYNIEKLINKAVQSGIAIYNIEKGTNTAKLTVSPKEFKKFAKLSKKYKCKIKIINKNGLFRLLFFMRLNILYFIGIIISVFIIYFLTRRVWIIDITGNTKLDKLSILTSCHNDGLYVGCNKNTLDCKQIAENLKIKYKNISWINISLKGTAVHIKLSEEKPNTVTAINTDPCNIIAAVDCQISSIVTNKGTPMVKKNDIVKAGDILISAKLKPSGNEESPVEDIVNAKGTVRGIVKRNFSFTVPFNAKEKQYTNNVKTLYTIKFFDKSIKLNKTVTFNQKDTAKEVIQLNLGENCPLPIFICKDINKEFIYVPVKRDVKTAKKIADKTITQHIIENYDIDSDIISVTTKTNETKDCLQVSSEIISEENIGKEAIYEDLGGNTLNGAKENSNIS